MITALKSGLMSRLLLSASVIGLLSACAVAPQPISQTELKTQAVADRQVMFAAQEPLNEPLSLPDAVARALKYNLDHRTKLLEKALALGQTDLDRWDVLPKITAAGGYVGRSDHNTTRSTDSVTLRPALSDPYYSTDRDRLTASLGTSWNVLDFGVSYYNSRENANRVLIAEEHRRKTIQNVVQEVRYDFWRAAAAQVLKPAVDKALIDGDRALADIRQVEAANLKSPAENLRLEKTLLETLRQLETISQELFTAKVELAALINLPPGTDYTLAIPNDMAMVVPNFSIPVERMEEIAFVNNPDLREQSYQARISLDETRKSIVRVMPGISLSADRSFDSNRYLVDRQWYDVSAQMSWNLINLLSLPDQLSQNEASETVVKARRLALSMAVLAQVHVSYLQFQNAGRQFQRSDELYRVENRLSDLSAARTSNDAQGVLENISSQTSTIAASLRRYQTYAQVQQALGRIYATIGEDLLPANLAATDLPTLTKTVANSLDAWDRGVEPTPEAAPEPTAPASEPAGQ